MTGRNAARLGLALLLVAGVGACSSRAAPGATMRGGIAQQNLPGTSGRSCRLASPDDALPDFSRLARLGTRGNIALWGLALAASDTVVLSVRYDEDGRLAWVRAIDSSLAADRVVPLERLLMHSLDENGPPDWGVRVRVAGGDVEEIAPSVICPPEPRGGLRQRVTPLATSRRDLQALEQVRGRRFPIQISLDSNGGITGVRLGRSSGDSFVDQFLMDWVFGTRFEPKLHDGIRMAATLEEELYIPFRRR